MQGSEVSAFRALVYEKAASCYRDLPWRKNEDPYAIMVSEFMLQQTQVARVVPKYLAWMERFPSTSSLARASGSEVLMFWSGLGYNRRALALHQACRLIESEFGGKIPPEEKALRSLPGIGAYTSRAILAFAFNLPVAFLETNIRTVFLKHFFPDATGVPDRELEKVVDLVLDREEPRRWYTALMDYGAEIKRLEGNHSVRGKAYRKQSDFETSFRRIRGAVLKRIVDDGPVGMDELYASLPFSRENIEKCAGILAREGFITYSGDRLQLKKE